MEIKSLFENIKEMSNFANKDLGQNYLIDIQTCQNIVNLLSENEDNNILEIGSGFGSLSVFLLNKKFRSLSLNDVDPISIDFLNKLKNNSEKNIEVLNKSALKLDLSTYNSIISNIPYYLTNDILEHCFAKSDANEYVFMVQKEAFDRLIAKIKTENYGPLSVLIECIGDIKKEFIVPKTAFAPIPHVDSLVFSVKKTKEINVDKYKFLIFLKRMFLHRRKTIYNNLSLYLSNKNKAKDLLMDLNVSLLSRPEEINAEMYLNIFKETL